MTIISKFNCDIFYSDYFKEISSLCSNYKWKKYIIKNELIYRLNNKELIFRIINDIIQVSIPLKSSNYNYVTSFKNLDDSIKFGIKSIVYFNN